MYGFREKYTCWTSHGEEDVNDPDGDTHEEGALGCDVDAVIPNRDIMGIADDFIDRGDVILENLEEMVRNAKGYDEYNDKEFAKFQEFVWQPKVPLY